MIDLKDARKLVEERIAGMGTGVDSWTPVITEVEEFEKGWVIYYGAAEPEVLLAGNAPFLVDRATAEVFATGTAYPSSVYIENYLRTGSPHE